MATRKKAAPKAAKKADDFVVNNVTIAKLIAGPVWVDAGDTDYHAHRDHGYLAPITGEIDDDGTVEIELTDKGRSYAASHNLASPEEVGIQSTHEPAPWSRPVAIEPNMIAEPVTFTVDDATALEYAAKLAIDRIGSERLNMQMMGEEEVIEVKHKPVMGFVAPDEIVAAERARVAHTTSIKPVEDLSHISDEIDDYIPPTIVREKAAKAAGERKTRKAPVREKLNLEALEIGQSRHIAATAEKPEPHKSYASSVALANGQYAEAVVGEDGEPVMRMRSVRGAPARAYPVLKYSRRFKIVAVGSEDPKGPGARVIRVQPDDESGE